VKLKEMEEYNKEIITQKEVLLKNYNNLERELNKSFEVNNEEKRNNERVINKLETLNKSVKVLLSLIMDNSKNNKTFKEFYKKIVENLGRLLTVDEQI
jgi:2-hydroxy-3-keto-5-methylthiopentenyl-1-phosphate phosphatase